MTRKDGVWLSRRRRERSFSIFSAVEGRGASRFSRRWKGEELLDFLGGRQELLFRGSQSGRGCRSDIRAGGGKRFGREIQGRARVNPSLPRGRGTCTWFDSHKADEGGFHTTRHHLHPWRFVDGSAVRQQKKNKHALVSAFRFLLLLLKKSTWHQCWH